MRLRRLVRPAQVLGGALFVLGLVGCTDARVPVEGEVTGASSGPAATSTTASTTPSTSTASTGAADTGSSTSSDATGLIFLNEPDGGGLDLECDLFAQDCPRGEKCVAWASDGGDVFNATKCVPVVDDPAGPGETCHVEGSPYSGIDDCEHGAMCWNVDPDTLEGFCAPLCTGDESNPYCDEPNWVCNIPADGYVICKFWCDPIEQNCPEGQACYPILEEWGCASDASGDTGAYGESCRFINVCDPGLICLVASTVPPGQPCDGATGCCTEVCDLDDPLGDQQCAGAAEGQTCQPWYDEGAAPTGYEDVGVCTLPQ
jgi:hypothetical protein